MGLILDFFHSTHFLFLPVFLIASLFVLGRSAEVIVDIAVILSLKLKISRLIIGATIISLGTTLPEVVVSVLASFQGKGSIALGNAVGSIICDTALILGFAILIGKIPSTSSLVNKQGWFQLFAGFLLVFACVERWDLSYSLSSGGHLPQMFGFICLFLLILYLSFSIFSAKKYSTEGDAHIEFDEKLEEASSFSLSFYFIAACLLLAVSSEVLILSASEMALRLEIPQSIIAVTLVAFGTSVPELVTSVIAVKKGYGDIALGNIIGADILNVLLVAGISVAFTKGGFEVDPSFFSKSFPVMIMSLVVLRFGLIFSKDYLKKSVGVVLLLLYSVFTLLNLKEFF